MMFLSRYKGFFTAVYAVCALGIMPLEAAHAQSFLDKLKSMVGKDKSISTAALSQADIAAGLKEALQVGTETVVANLGTVDGFNADSAIHIPLPSSLKKAQSLLGKVGLSSIGDDLELEMNRAAEAATPKAKALFLQAIKDMTLEDVTAIYKGADDAAIKNRHAAGYPQKLSRGRRSEHV